jgi:MFS family permease
MRIGGSLFIGLFVAFIDRSNLSVTLPAITQELSLKTETATLLLTIFLIGYAFSNFFGGILTMKYDPKYVVIAMVAIWSLATIYIGFSNSIFALLACRLLLGVTEGVYWPQQSRFAKDWFSDKERSRANSVIQFHGQFLALAIGFLILMPLEAAFGWRTVFILTGLLGLLIVIPLFTFVLRPQTDAPFYQPTPGATGKVKLSWDDLGGKSFILLLFSYISQGFLFWGITLWIPMVASSLGFQGMSRAFASSIPYMVAIILVIPMSHLSDKTGKRIQVASLGLFLPGICMFVMPFVENPYLKIGLITFSMAYYTASYTPNFWSILQMGVAPHAAGAASGIVSGLGAGGGGTLAGFMVGYLYAKTGSYMWGFMVIGIIVLLGSFCLYAFGKVRKML